MEGRRLVRLVVGIATFVASLVTVGMLLVPNRAKGATVADLFKIEALVNPVVAATLTCLLLGIVALPMVLLPEQCGGLGRAGWPLLVLYLPFILQFVAIARSLVEDWGLLLFGWTVAAGTSLGLAIAGHVLQIVWPAEEDGEALASGDAMSLKAYGRGQ
jgi:hypothetical protein